MTRTRTRRSPPARPPLTFAWSYPIVLTHRCACACAYCPLPATAGAALPSISRVKSLIDRAQQAGVMQVRLTGGEGVEDHPEIVSTYRFYGFRSYWAYLEAVMGELAQNGVRPPLFPELDLGALSFYQMQRLRSCIFTLRLYLDSMDPRLQYTAPHRLSRAKWPRQRLGAIVNAGRLEIPINSGLMVGIGESADSRLRTLEVLARVSRRYGHLQSVTVQPFEPQPRTPMSAHPRPSLDELLATVEAAREMLPREVTVQFPVARLPERALDFIDAGAGDLGEFELTGIPSRDGPAVTAYKIVRDRLAARGLTMADRLSLFPRFAGERWVAPHYRGLLRGAASAGRAA